MLAPFQARVKETIRVATRWLKSDPKDVDVMMIIGAAYGVSSRMRLQRRRWIRAYFDGRKAVKYIRRAIRTDPDLHDARLGTGMYDYYSDTYPRFGGESE